MCKSSALAGWKEEKIFFERVCKTLPRLVGWLFLFPTSQGRAFHTLSKNILFLQPARAEILLTPSENIKFFRPIRREFFKPSQGIFSSFSQPGQKNFSHLQKILNSFGQSGESFYTPSQRIFYSSSQSGQKNDLMVLFRRIKNISKKNSFTIKK